MPIQHFGNIFEAARVAEAELQEAERQIQSASSVAAIRAVFAGLFPDLQPDEKYDIDSMVVGNEAVAIAQNLVDTISDNITSQNAEYAIARLRSQLPYVVRKLRADAKDKDAVADIDVAELMERLVSIIRNRSGDLLEFEAKLASETYSLFDASKMKNGKRYANTQKILRALDGDVDSLMEAMNLMLDRRGDALSNMSTLAFNALKRKMEDTETQEKVKNRVIEQGEEIFDNVMNSIIVDSKDKKTLTEAFNQIDELRKHSSEMTDRLKKLGKKIVSSRAGTLLTADAKNLVSCHYKLRKNERGLMNPPLSQDMIKALKENIAYYEAKVNPKYQKDMREFIDLGCERDINILDKKNEIEKTIEPLLTKELMDNIKLSLIKKGSITSEDARNWAESVSCSYGAKNNVEGDIKGMLAEFRQITGGKLDTISVRSTSEGMWGRGGGRSYHVPHTGTIYLGPKTKADTVFHELSHDLEEKNPVMSVASWRFIKDRSNGKKSVSMNTAVKHIDGYSAGYSRDEKAFEDQFVHPYVGKDYSARYKHNYDNMSFAHEVLSMGIEGLADVKTFKEMMLKDREHLKLTLGMLAMPKQ